MLHFGRTGSTDLSQSPDDSEKLHMCTQSHVFILKLFSNDHQGRDGLPFSYCELQQSKRFRKQHECRNSHRVNWFNIQSTLLLACMFLPGGFSLEKLSSTTGTLNKSSNLFYKFSWEHHLCSVWPHYSWGRMETPGFITTRTDPCIHQGNVSIQSEQCKLTRRGVISLNLQHRVTPLKLELGFDGILSTQNPVFKLLIESIFNQLG